MDLSIRRVVSNVAEFQSGVFNGEHVDVPTQRCLFYCSSYLFFNFFLMHLCVCARQGEVHFGAGHQGGGRGHQAQERRGAGKPAFHTRLAVGPVWFHRAGLVLSGDAE